MFTAIPEEEAVLKQLLYCDRTRWIHSQFQALYKAFKETESYFVQNHAGIVVGATELFCYTLKFYQ